MKSYLKQTRISPKKANLVAALVRRKSVTEAVNILKFTQKKAAPILKKLIESAAANAEHNSNQKREHLHIKEIIVNEGPTLKRRVMISRGRAHPILKRTSHITVQLETKGAPEKPKTKAKSETEEAPKAADKPETSKNEETPKEEKAEKKDEEVKIKVKSKK